MGTYVESHYVTGRADYRCDGCGDLIRRRTRHLVYSSPVARWRRICDRCSVLLDSNGLPLYQCRAVEERLSRVAQAAAPREQYPKPKD